VARIILLVSALLLGFAPSANAADFEGNSLSITFSSKSIPSAVTGGTRGPALAVLKDDTILLGGGRSGGEILTWNKKQTALRSLGKFIPANRREVDSRFAINDIAVLSEKAASAKLLISYPRLGSSGSCVEIAVDELVYDRKKQKVRFVANWFVSKPCVSANAVQHTAGRFAVIDRKSVYVTIGDLGYSEIDNRSKRGDLGSIRPGKTGSHEGFAEPIKYWVPSIAPTELVQLPENGWGQWGKALVLGTLREEILLFMKVSPKFEVSESLSLDFGHRIRDLEMLNNGAMIATTDSGKLITVRNA
jgi:hypothetical protein